MRNQLLIIAEDFPPRFSAGVPRVERFARYLPDFGWQPLVLCRDHNSDDHNSDDQEALSSEHAKLLESLIVKRRRAWSFPRGRKSSAPQPVESSPAAISMSLVEQRRTSFSRRLCGKPMRFAGNLRDLFFRTPDKTIGWLPPAVLAGRRMIRENRPQAIFTTAPPPTLHLVGLLLKKLTGLPWITDFRDPWGRRPWGPKSHNPWGQRLHPLLEKICVRAADRVILNTERMADDFRRHYPQCADKFLAIPNGCDALLAARVEQFLHDSPAKRSGEPLTLIHAGSLYRQRDPRPLIEAIALLNKRGTSIHFEQIGYCAPYFQFEDFLRDRGWNHLATMSPPVPRDEALRRLAAADLLLLIQPGTDLQIPGKLFEMLPYHKPIVTIADDGATADLINQYHLGAVANGQTPEAIAAAISDALKQRDSQEIGSGWEAAFRDFDGSALTATLARTLDFLISDEKSGRFTLSGEIDENAESPQRATTHNDSQTITS